MWQFMSPLARQPSPAAWRAQSAKRESWKPNSIATGRGSLRRACLSPLPATWWCPTVSSCCLVSGLLGLNPVKQSTVRLTSMKEGRVLRESMLGWCRLSVGCLFINYFVSSFRKSEFFIPVNAHKQVSPLIEQKFLYQLIIFVLI